MHITTLFTIAFVFWIVSSAALLYFLYRANKKNAALEKDVQVLRNKYFLEKSITSMFFPFLQAPKKESKSLEKRLAILENNLLTPCKTIFAENLLTPINQVKTLRNALGITLLELEKLRKL